MAYSQNTDEKERSLVAGIALLPQAQADWGGCRNGRAGRHDSLRLLGMLHSRCVAGPTRQNLQEVGV